MWRKIVTPLESKVQTTGSTRDQNFVSNQDEKTHKEFLNFAKDVLFWIVNSSPNGENLQKYLALCV